MSEDRITATFRCLACNQPTELSLPDDYTDDSIATCKLCGEAFGRFGDIKAKVKSEAADVMKGKVRDAFKGLKGWTIK